MIAHHIYANSAYDLQADSKICIGGFQARVKVVNSLVEKKAIKSKVIHSFNYAMHSVIL